MNQLDRNLALDFNLNKSQKYTWQDLLIIASQFLKENSIITASLDSLVLLEYCLKIDRNKLLTNLNTSATIKLINSFKKLVQLRSSHYPIAYITGQKEFYGFNFHVTRDVLIPRPETEGLIDQFISLIEVKYPIYSKNQGSRILNDLSQPLILDIGTGSGNIAITLNKLYPNIVIYGLDYSLKALKIAKLNNKLNNSNVQFIKSNILNNLPSQLFQSKQVIIVANLPYLANNYCVDQATKFEPTLALYAGLTGLDYYNKLFSSLNKFNQITNLDVIIEALPEQLIEIRKLALKFNLQLEYNKDFIYQFSYTNNQV